MHLFKALISRFGSINRLGLASGAVAVGLMLTPYALAAPVEDLDAALANHLPAAATVDVRLSRCPTCGAEIEFDGTHRYIRVSTIPPGGIMPYARVDALANAATGGIWRLTNEPARKERRRRPKPAPADAETAKGGGAEA